MKHIITIQHTQSEQHLNGMIGSWTDWSLTDLGHRHAENIGRKLSAELNGQDWKIYCSDLTRAKQTAQPLARYMGLEVTYLEQLREHNIGEAVGKSKQWTKENGSAFGPFDPDARWFKGAETWREFWRRVTNLHREILADKAKNIILVSHGGTLAVWHQVWLGESVQESKFGPAGGVSFMSTGGTQQLNNLSYIED